MPKKVVSSEQILKKSLELADKSSWEALRLHQVASALHTDLNTIHKYYREKEDIADDWFEHADQAMLKAAKKKGFDQLDTQEQIETLLMVWFQYLAKYQRVSKEMVYGKLEPGHLHVLFPAILRVSRTMQWLREATHQDATFLQRAIEETGLTGIFLMTLVTFVNDRTFELEKTNKYLNDKLTSAKKLKKSLARW